jgi:hypothetical protein
VTQIHEPALRRVLKGANARWQVVDGSFYATTGVGLWRVPDPALAEHLKLDAAPLPDGTIETLLERHSTTMRAEPTGVLIDDPSGVVTRVFRTEGDPVQIDVALLAPVCEQGKTYWLPADMDWRFGTSLLVGRWAGMVAVAVMELVRGNNVQSARLELAGALEPLT